METRQWFLMKHEDGTIFGPIGFDQLRQWAVDAYIAPLDKVSCDDQQTWNKAPMVPELQMDYLLELDNGHYYGPTTVGAVREFLAKDEITPSTLVTNCRTAETKPLAEFGVFQPPGDGDDNIGKTPIREYLQDRIRKLEEALLEERRLRQCAEEKHAKAEARFAELKALLP